MAILFKNMPQLAFPFPTRTSFSADSFFVSECNRAAHMAVTSRQSPAAHALYLHGEKNSGKSHLASIWAQNERAVIMESANIKPEEVDGNCVAENIENCPDETALLHLFNHTRDIGARLLLTASCPLSGLPFSLPDLVSRLRACPVAAIGAPDDRLLAALMRKQFSDRQLPVDGEVISYLAARVQRSFSGVQDLVAAIDRESLAEGRNITIPFVKQILHDTV